NPISTAASRSAAASRQRSALTQICEQCGRAIVRDGDLQYSRLVGQLHEEGYQRGEPPPSPGGEEIDRNVCREATCHSGGHKGLEYPPFIRKAGGHVVSYRAIARRPKCGTAEEL